jgi:sulfonate transport system permease protein
MKRKQHYIAWIIPILFVVCWQLFGSEDTIPTPLQVWESALRLYQDGSLIAAIWVSTKRALLGFIIGGSIGFLFGLFNGLAPVLAKLLDTSIQMIRTIPHLALIPLVITWFGVDESGKLFLVALGVAFPIYLNTYHGIINVDKGLIEMGKVYGLRSWALFTKVLLPGALPSILVGIRYALGIMWMSLIVAETIASDSGIGYMAMSAREFMQMDIVILSILLYAFLGKFSDVIASMMEKRWLRWHPSFSKNKDE